MSLGPPGYGTSWVPSDLTEEPYALTRTYGSVRGAAGNGRPYRDCSLSLVRDSYKTIVPATAEHPTATAHALFFGGSRLIIIAASGIFGDLRIEIASPLEWGFVTGASVLALLFSALVGGLTFRILHPRAWHTGADIEWLARWSGASARDLKDATLDALMEGFVANNEVTRERGDLLVWLLWAVAIQTVCVVSVQVAATT